MNKSVREASLLELTASFMDAITIDHASHAYATLARIFLRLAEGEVECNVREIPGHPNASFVRLSATFTLTNRAHLSLAQKLLEFFLEASQASREVRFAFLNVDCKGVASWDEDDGMAPVLIPSAPGP